MGSVEDVHESMSWWLYYSTLPYMFRRIIKQPSGCFIQTCIWNYYKKFVFCLKKRAH